MSTKSSSKFWKKLGLGKKTSTTQVNRPPSIQSHATNTNSTLANHDDDYSIKTKRLSGVHSQRKQSTNSMKRLYQLTADPPALPTTTHPGIESKQAPGTTPTTPLPQLKKNTNNLDFDVKQVHHENHVDTSTPPLDPDLGNSHNDTTTNYSTDDQPCFTTLEPSNIKSCSTDDSTMIHSTTESPLTQRKSTTSLKKATKTSSLSRLRQPSRTNSTTSTTSTTCSITSSSSVKREGDQHTVPPLPIPFDSSNASFDEKDKLIQQLEESLQTEKSINRVLQGQKEAITRDLDYFSLTVDELMEEKESLVQKYEEEKVKSQSKEEDLNILLDKLKASTENARERSMEVDQWKAELENLKKVLSSERNEMKSALKRKDQEIARLKNELAGTKDDIKALSSRLDQVSHGMKSTSKRSPPTIETPSASPRLDALKCNDDTQIAGPKHNGPSTLLDDELMILTKEKEKLQSDYSKIPLSGGGPTSRRRKEQLEEMLDEVDSQLSKVKQKIRRS
ncbi:hypothetical protein BC941DRAFT_426386 [Chlamydoabsidia padenii]|nr:hypothetical protein BC941DRAFT_426386 [Chlamydoabsidia padenii]